LKTKDAELIDLVHKMMQYSPKRRITPYEALKHPYFDELKN
jgi:serine/threonine protein kinase